MNFALILVFYLCSVTSAIHVTKKWANGSYTAFNVPRHNETDLVNITTDYQTIQNVQWYEGYEKPTMAGVFVPIWVATGRWESNDWELEMYNAACYYNRTVDEGKLFKVSGLDPRLDPCIEYAAKYYSEAKIETKHTIDYIISNTEFKGQYYEPLRNRNECIEGIHRRELTKTSFDYEAYVEELGKYLSVAKEKDSSEHYTIETNKGPVYCKPRQFQRCYMNKNLFVARCLIVNSHFKNMKLH